MSAEVLVIRLRRTRGFLIRRAADDSAKHGVVPTRLLASYNHCCSMKSVPTLLLLVREDSGVHGQDLPTIKPAGMRGTDKG